jgi:hypothetical protein
MRGCHDVATSNDICFDDVISFGPVIHGREKTTFPTDDEIQLLLTQADRAMQQYKPLIDEEERQLGKKGADAVAKDREVVKNLELALKAFKKQPQGFNSPLGFAFFEWLDDASRNALLCSQTAMYQATTLMMDGKLGEAPQYMHLSQACMDASTLIYTGMRAPTHSMRDILKPRKNSLMRVPT